MEKRSSLPARKFLALASVIALSAAITGCGNNSKPDVANGKTLFIAKCGGCHMLARANTAGAIGPSLDDAFARARKDGMGNTIEGVVKSQIAVPSQKLYPKSLIMPANIVTGSDAADVAAYVGLAAAAPGKDTGALALVGGGTDGKSLFKTNCGSCHVLADAGTVGAVGPQLDGTKKNLAGIIAQVTNGKGAMPAFGGTLSKEQIELVSEYVEEARGK